MKKVVIDGLPIELTEEETKALMSLAKNLLNNLLEKENFIFNQHVERYIDDLNSKDENTVITSVLYLLKYLN